MTKPSLFTLFAVAFLFSNHTALAQTDTGQDGSEEEGVTSPDGNGSTWWPDSAIDDLLDELVNPNDEE